MTIIAVVVFCFIVSPTATLFHEETHGGPGHDPATHRSIVPHSDIPEIVFDESHKQWWSLWDTGFIGYSDLAAVLMEEGYKVSANTGDLASAVEGMDIGDVLVLGMTSTQVYTQDEIDSIIDFVGRGGGLLLMGEHEYPNGEPWYFNVMQNQVSTHFGIHFNSNELTDPSGAMDEQGIWLKTDVDFFDVKDVGLFFCNSMNLTGNADALATTTQDSVPPSVPIIAKSFHGEGRVIGVTDSEFIWNGDEYIGLHYGNNSVFTSRLFGWLSQSTGPDEDTGIMPEYNLITADSFELNVTVLGETSITAEIEGGEIYPHIIDIAEGTNSFRINVESDGVIRFKAGGIATDVWFLKPPEKTLATTFFHGGNGCRKVDDSLGGMLSFAKILRDNGISSFGSTMEEPHGKYDSVIIVNPLERQEGFNASPDVKYLLLDESHTWVYGIEWPGKYDHNLRNAPINDFASVLGLEFPYYTIFDPDADSLRESFNPTVHHEFGFDINLYRSGILVSQTNMTSLANAGGNSWGELLDPGDAYFILNAVDYRTTDCIMYDEKVFGMSDTDPLTNTHINEPGSAQLADSIASWIIISGDIRETNDMFNRMQKVSLTARPTVTDVEVTMEDGTRVVMNYNSASERWEGTYIVPSYMGTGTYTAEVNLIEFGEMGYLIELDYAIAKDNNIIAFQWIIIIIIALSIIITICFLKNKNKNIKKYFLSVWKNKK